MEQTPTNSKRKLILWIAIPVVILGILLTIASMGLNTFLKPTIKKALEDVVIQGSDSLYTFSLGNYSVGPGGRTVTLHQLEVVIDSNRYRILKAANQLPPLIFSIKIEAVVITGLEPWSLWRHHNIFCGEVAMANATIILQQQQRSDTIVTTNSKTFYELIQPNIHNIRIQKLDISNSDITFKTIKRQTKNLDSWQIKNMNIQLNDIVVDSLSYADTSRILYASDLNTSFDGLAMKTQDAVYQYSLGKTDYDFKKRLVHIAGVKLQPAITQDAFNKRFGHAKDRFTMDVPQITIENFNASALLIEDKIEAESIVLESPVLDIFKDKTAGIDNTSKMGTYPQQLLLQAESPINIKQIAFKNGALTFTEKSPKTELKGSFTFTNIDGAITNVTNQPLVYAKEPWCKASMTANFMGNNKMSVHFNFDLASKDAHFIIDAGLKSLQATQVNTAFKSLAKADLESFILDDLQYHIEGNETMATANLTLLYHDLKLNVFKTDDDGNFKKKKLISMLANLLKIYSANPMSGQPMRLATNIKNPRPITKNLFGYAVFTMLKGVQEIVIKGKNKTLPGMGN